MELTETETRLHKFWFAFEATILMFSQITCNDFTVSDFRQQN